jgi:hypothetical protein
MQISTSVGVVQAISRPSSYVTHGSLSRFRPWRKRQQSEAADQKPDAISECSKKRNRTLGGSGYSLPARGRQSPSRGEQLTTSQLRYQKIKQPPAVSRSQYAALACANNRRRRMPAMRPSQLFFKNPSRGKGPLARPQPVSCRLRLSVHRRLGVERKDRRQKCHRCAFETRKSRNTWTRATVFNSSG